MDQIDQTKTISRGNFKARIDDEPDSKWSWCSKLHPRAGLSLIAVTIILKHGLLLLLCTIFLQTGTTIRDDYPGINGPRGLIASHIATVIVLTLSSAVIS